MRWAYYNDNDSDACAWLRELMRDGEIPDGEIDSRSIEEVQPEDIREFGQVHLFAGIAGWPLALRWAGRADRPLWTASCPCPPFSVAGKPTACPRCESTNLVWCPRRTGFAICADCEHAWIADSRHLWPEVWRLIARCRPGRVFGEQVASPTAIDWIAAVQASLEILGYGTRTEGRPASSVGAVQKRQRLWWMADIKSDGWNKRSDAIGSRSGRTTGGSVVQSSSEGRIKRSEAATTARHGRSAEPAGRADCSVGEPGSSRLEGHDRHGDRGDESGRFETKAPRPASETGSARILESAHSDGRRARIDDPEASRGRQGLCDVAAPSVRQSEASGESESATGGSSPWREHWTDIGWIFCRDGKWRAIPTEPTILPVAARVPGRVGLLRGAGNAICPQVAAQFVEDCFEDDEELD